MPVAAAIAGAAVIGGASSIIAGNKAAKAQTRAAQTAADANLTASREANALEKEMFETTRSDYAPWRAAGEKALGTLEEMYLGGEPEYEPIDYSGFETSPGYQFRVDEAMKAIERSAAARGNLLSGATADALQRRVQGVASDEYGRYVDDQWRQRNDKTAQRDTYVNRLAAMAGIGQTATAATAAAGQSYASSAGDNIVNAGRAAGDAAIAGGNARASSYVNTANAVNGTVQNLASLYLYGQGGGFGGGGAKPTPNYLQGIY